jgi:hypothetical protein
MPYLVLKSCSIILIVPDPRRFKDTMMDELAGPSGDVHCFTYETELEIFVLALPSSNGLAEGGRARRKHVFDAMASLG